MSYATISKELLKEKIEQALLVLESCHICPLKCGAKRINNGTGLCRSGRNAVISGYGSHYGDFFQIVILTASSVKITIYPTLEKEQKLPLRNLEK